MNTGIYTITNLVNGKIYVGSTEHSFKKRWTRHISDLRKNKHGSIHLQSSFNKYGEKNFKFEILEEVEKVLCRDLERYWITVLNTKNKNFGYNTYDPKNDGAGIPRSENIKKKISETCKKYQKTEEHKQKLLNSRKGVALSKEHKSKIGDANRGRTITNEQKLKMSISAKNRPKRILSKETKQKMSLAWEKRRTNKKAQDNLLIPQQF